MGTAIQKALDILEARKAQYRATGIGYFRPWIFMITDGEPQGESDGVAEEAARRVKDAEANKRVAFFAVGVESANLERLSGIIVRTPVKLTGLNFQEMFLWLSRSMAQVSRSQVDDEQIALPPPGWAAI